MIRSFLIRLLPPHLQPKLSKKEEQKRKISKRQKFIAAVLLLSFGLFSSEYLFSGYGVLFAGVLAIVTDLFVVLSLGEDLTANFSFYPLILPFLWSLSFGFFYFLAPARLITRIILTTLFAIGMYSVLLSENIFVVASIRTIGWLVFRIKYKLFSLKFTILLPSPNTTTLAGLIFFSIIL